MALPQEAPVWARPEYWGGVSVDAPGTYNSPTPRPHAPSDRQQHAANYVLATSLESVISGDFEEAEAAAGGSFDPRTTELEDGAVLILERERLTRANYHETWPQPTHEHLGNLPDDIAEFTQYWREQSKDVLALPDIERRSFGMTGKELSYERSLAWGVLVPIGNVKVVLCWDPYDFARALDVQDGAVSFNPDKEDVSIIPTPTYLGRAEASRKGHKNIFLPRSIERTTAVRSVKAESATDYRQAYKNAGQISTLAIDLPVDLANLHRLAEIMYAASFPPAS